MSKIWHKMLKKSSVDKVKHSSYTESGVLVCPKLFFLIAKIICLIYMKNSRIIENKDRTLKK